MNLGYPRWVELTQGQYERIAPHLAAQRGNVILLRLRGSGERPLHDCLMKNQVHETFVDTYPPDHEREETALRC